MGCLVRRIMNERNQLIPSEHGELACVGGQKEESASTQVRIDFERATETSQAIKAP